MTGASAPPVVEYSPPTEDLAAIRQIVADTETAYNTNDAELMTKHFARNATVVNAMGVTLSGVDAQHVGDFPGGPVDAPALDRKSSDMWS